MSDTLYSNYYRSKTVVVTGGAGVLGSQLVGRLVALGAQVRVIDNLSRGRIDRLGSLAAHISFMPSCITNKAISTKVLTGASHLFHLAHAKKDASSVDCTHINIEGSMMLYEAASAVGIQSIVFAAPVSNTDTAYRTSIARAEQLGAALAQQTNTSVANIRIFHGGDSLNQIIPALLHAGLCSLLRGHTIEIGNADTSRLQRLLAYKPEK